MYAERSLASKDLGATRGLLSRLTGYTATRVVRQLAVGSAAINTLWQFGSFLSPYARGVAKDATGDYRAGLIGASVVAVADALPDPIRPCARYV